MSVTPPPPEELNRELDVLLAAEDNTVREEAASSLAKNNARVASERLTGTNPNGEPVYDGETKTIDGHTIKIDKTTDGDVLVAGNKVVMPDIEASNGVIHGIDGVITETTPEPEA